MFIVLLVAFAVVIFGAILIIQTIKKANTQVVANNSQDKKLSKDLSERLKSNTEVIKVLEIGDNIAALSKCATLFEKDIITKSELMELEEYIKSRI